ncbi:MAG TPA: hypothetical protein VGC66_09795 [Pyrinomonadaceae bacterium]|jgi:hypothetical protein
MRVWLLIVASLNLALGIAPVAFAQQCQPNLIGRLIGTKQPGPDGKIHITVSLNDATSIGAPPPLIVTIMMGKPLSTGI